MVEFLFHTQEAREIPSVLARMARTLEREGQRNPRRPGVHAMKKLSDAYTPVELNHVRISVPLVRAADRWAHLTCPNMPWAEKHFMERISREPYNPAPSHEEWPFARASNSEHRDEQGQFSHTYPERFWPKFANTGGETREGRQSFVPHVGIRFAYGDFEDLLTVMRDNPYTRQGYLPIWFPEDLTAATKKERVPCTLGYHFLVTPAGLDVEYHIRSCDAGRFLADDLYMAGRLAQVVAQEIRNEMANSSELLVEPLIWPSRLIMNIGNLHCFVGDQQDGSPLRRQVSRWDEASLDDEEDWSPSYA